jgi:hypothetical protein
VISALKENAGGQRWLRPLLAGMLVLLPLLAMAADEESYSRWVPKGWRLEKAVTGDLDKDNVADVVLVLQQNDRRKRVRNEGLGAFELNLNPRRFLVLLNSPDGLRKVAETSRFLPSANDADSPCLADPLEEGGVRIERDLLFIDLHYWLSCGSWGVSHNTFTFRWENGRLRLIGLDGYEFMRNTGERSETSTNFLTGKRKMTAGLNESDALAKPSVSWKRIPAIKPLYLDQMSSFCDAEDQPQKWCQ